MVRIVTSIQATPTSGVRGLGRRRPRMLVNVNSSTRGSMQRRQFLTAGAAVSVAAGLASLANPAGAPGPSKTIFDFGARGDGSSDDSGAFTAALQYAAANGQIVI